MEFQWQTVELKWNFGQTLFQTAVHLCTSVWWNADWKRNRVPIDTERAFQFFVTFFFAATCLGPCLNWRNVSSWSHRLSITSVTIVSFPVSSWPYFFLFSLPLLRYLHRVCVCNGLLISRWRIQLKNGLCSYLSNWSHFHWIEICNIHLQVEGFTKWRWWFDFDLAETCAPTLNRVWWIFVDFFSLYGADAARKTGFFFFFCRTLFSLNFVEVETLVATGEGSQVKCSFHLFMTIVPCS